MSSELGSHEHSSNDNWRLQLTRIVLGLVVVASALAIGPGTTAAQGNQTFIVEQGSQCVQITPLGDGTQSVEEFYDYKILNDTANYSSLGTTDIQLDQTIQVFVYRGSEGLSLVFLNDKIGEPGGYVATADISGLPEDGQWVVEDDNYTNRDDSFEYNNTSAHIEWSANGRRTDGAAFRGLGSPNYSTITLDIKFNDETDRYPFEEWSGSPEQNQIEQWIARSDSGETTELDMSQPAELSPGTCNGGVSTFTARPTSAGNATTETTNTETARTVGTSPTQTATETPTRGSETPTPTVLQTTETSTTTAIETATATETSTTTAIQTATATHTPTLTSTLSPATETANSVSSPGGATEQTTADSLLPETDCRESTCPGGATEQTTADRSGTEAFGPGFGIGIAILAALILTVSAVARRDD